MPAAKPATLPRWATNGGTTTAPTSGHQDTGWTDGEQPSAEIMNWLENLDYQWEAYLNDFEIQAHTWTVLQTYSAGVSVTGGALAVTGNATVGGTLGVTGAFSSAGASVSTLHATSTAALDGAITGGASLQLDTFLNLDHGDHGDGTLAKGLIFGGAANTAGVLSKRTATGNQYGLDLFTGGSSRLSITSAGAVSIPGALTCGSVVVTSGPAMTDIGAGDPAWGSGVTQSAGSPQTCYWKDSNGMVQVSVYAGFSAASTKTVLTLPVGYRPPAIQLGPAMSGSGVASYFTIGTGGVITAAALTGTITSIQITFAFRPDQNVG